MKIVGINTRKFLGFFLALSLLLTGAVLKVEAQSVDVARVAFENGNYEEASAILRDVLSNGKKNTDAHYLLGVILKRQGHTDDALSEFLFAEKQQ